jgi:hypothetical protein
MNSRKGIGVVMIAGLAALSTAACSSAGKTRLTSSSICQAAGGTYSGGTCSPGRSPLTAQQMCAAHNGVYFSGGDYCEFEGSWKP